MHTSDATGAISEALAKAQGLLTDPPAKGVNPHFKSKFARLQDGLPLIRAAFSKNGLSFIQSIDPEKKTLVTRIGHSSGEWLELAYPIALDGNPQKQGSALTYARRYALFAAVGIAADDDDDGAKGSEPTPHHPSWEKGRAAFCAALGSMGLKYDTVKAFCEREGWGKPSTWPSEQRMQFAKDLENNERMRSACGGDA